MESWESAPSRLQGKHKGSRGLMVSVVGAREAVGRELVEEAGEGEAAAGSYRPPRLWQGD